MMSPLTANGFTAGKMTPPLVAEADAAGAAGAAATVGAAVVASVAGATVGAGWVAAGAGSAPPQAAITIIAINKETKTILRISYLLLDLNLVRPYANAKVYLSCFARRRGEHTESSGQLPLKPICVNTSH
jgi:hypothetical protein